MTCLLGTSNFPQLILGLWSDGLYDIFFLLGNGVIYILTTWHKQQYSFFLIEEYYLYGKVHRT